MAVTRMAVKKKQKRFSKVKAVKQLARDRVGTPPPTRKEEPQRRAERKSKKHKPTLGQMLQSEE